MPCDNIQIFDATSGMLEWDVPGFGEITGFADGSDSISVVWSDAGKNKMKVGSDGNSGSISVNNRTDGSLTVKLQPGSPMRAILQESWFADRIRRGDMTYTDTRTGEAFTFSCAHLEGPAQYDRGSEVPDSYDFVFNFTKSSYQPPRNAITQIGNS